MRRQPQTAPPAYFTALITMFLKSSPQLASELWEALGQRWPWRVTHLRYVLDQMVPGTATAATWEQRSRHFETLLSPRDLLALALLIAPEGQSRRRDVVQLEETILHYMTSEGVWR